MHLSAAACQVALRELAHAVDPAVVRGRLIIIPTVSMAAAEGWSREWPDGSNFNRVSPRGALRSTS